MDKKFYLMRKNEIITLIQFNDDGKMKLAGINRNTYYKYKR